MSSIGDDLGGDLPNSEKRVPVQTEKGREYHLNRELENRKSLAKRLVRQITLINTASHSPNNIEVVTAELTKLDEVSQKS